MAKYKCKLIRECEVEIYIPDDVKDLNLNSIEEVKDYIENDVDSCDDISFAICESNKDDFKISECTKIE